MDVVATADPQDQARDLRAEAARLLERAEDLRQQAEAAEQAAWRLQAEAAKVEAASRRGLPGRRRPRIQGHPALSSNRVIALMEALCIDEHVSLREGLDGPLRLVERDLGICYARRGRPTVGVRIAAAEEAMRSA